MSQDFQKPFTSPPTIFSVAVFVGIGLGLWVPCSALTWPVQATFGPLLILIGVMAIRKSMQDIDAAETTYDPYDVSTQLVTSGIYRRSRNPGYLGLALIQLGLAIAIDNMWIIATGVVAVLVTTRFVIMLEEKKLTDAFGAPYQDYMARVRRWI